MKRKTLPHNPKYPLKSFRVLEQTFVNMPEVVGMQLATPKPRGSYFAKKEGEK